MIAAERQQRRVEPLGIGVDRVAEQDEQQDRDGEHHREGDAVAPHLDEFLGEDRAEVEQRESIHDGRRSSRGDAAIAQRHEMNEHVLEACGAGGDRHAVLLGQRRQRRSEAIAVGPGDVQRRAERRDLLDAVERRDARHEGGRVRRRDDEGRQAGGAHHIRRGAGGEHLAVGNIVDAVAALRLVHVVGRDQHGEAGPGEAVDLVPKLAPRLRVDAGGRLVEQQQLRPVHDAGGERQSLLPPARQSAGDLMAARPQAELVERRRDDAAAIGEVVEPRYEGEVLLDRQVLIEREPLGHVADLALDAGAVAADVEAEHRALAGVGGQQAADHADGGRLARAVGAEKADDLTLGDPQRDMIDGEDAIERLGEAGNVDDVHRRLCGSSTSTIWPGCSFSATSWVGRASIR